MASVSNSSPTEDNTSGTDLSNIHTEDEENVDTTMWTPAKWKNYNIWWNFTKNINIFLVKKLPYVQS